MNVYWKTAIIVHHSPDINITSYLLPQNRMKYLVSFFVILWDFNQEISEFQGLNPKSFHKMKTRTVASSLEWET